MLASNPSLSKLCFFDDFLNSVCRILYLGQSGLVEFARMVIFCSTQKRSEIIALFPTPFV